MKKLIYSAIFILPLLAMAAFTLNHSAGVLAGDGHARTHSFPVTATEFELEISDPDPTGYRQIQMTVPVNKIDTGIGMRNTHMRKSMFDTKKYPNIIFVAKSDAQLSNAQKTLNGTLTINGVSQPHTLNINLSNISGQWVAAGETVISLTDYNLPHVGMGLMKVLDEVEMAFNITLPGN